MAKVKITGHASGTGIFTVTAPNSNTDRTITLPDGTGTLAFTTGDDDKLPLAGGAMTGTITNFTSTGINDDGDTNVITIDSSQRVGVNITPTQTLHISETNGAKHATILIDEVNDGNPVLQLQSTRDNSSTYRGSNIFNYGRGNGDTTPDVRGSTIAMNSLQGSSSGKIKGQIAFYTANDDTDASELGFNQDYRGNIGIGVIPEDWSSVYNAVQIGSNLSLAGRTNEDSVFLTNNAYVDSVDGRWEYIGANGTSEACLINMGNDGEFMVRTAPSGAADAALTWTTRFHVTNDGRGLSQFTAKAWVNFNGSGTLAIRDSHNISSVTDNGSGSYTPTFTNALANGDFVVTGNADHPGNWYGWLSVRGHSTSNCTVHSVQASSNASADAGQIDVLVFGD